MIAGKRLRIRYRPPLARRIWEVVADVLEVRDREVVLSLRPEAGTTTLDRDRITDFEETRDPVRLPRRVR